ncbi:lysophospholipase [Salmonella enterica]|nr:lysophospholipase [Salmonella enterica]
MIDFTKFIERYEQLKSLLPPPEKVSEYQFDGLYIRAYEPKIIASDILLVYHGGGVNSDAGYDVLARQLTKTLPVCVCLVDIRGHGRSVGHKGDISKPEQIWRDVDTVIQNVRTFSPSSRIHLLGHSSGGGMLINYFTRHVPVQKSDSLILLAPAYGPFAPSDLQIPSSVPFASVHKWTFIINALSAGFIAGNCIGVKLNFPAEVISSREDFVQIYSVNMANALTPRNPAKQLESLPLPVKILHAEHDELFDSCRMEAFAKGCHNPKISSRIVEGSTHLDCIFMLTDEMRAHFAELD